MTYVRPTARQKEVLLAVLETPTFEEAGLRLGIPAATVRSHLRNARRRSGLSTERLIYQGAVDGWLAVHEIDTLSRD